MTGSKLPLIEANAFGEVACGGVRSETMAIVVLLLKMRFNL